MLLKKSFKEIALIILGVVFICCYMYAVTPKAFGNASLALSTCSTGSSITGTLNNGNPITIGINSATATVNFLTTGVGTTTLNCDMYVGNASSVLADGGTLFVQLAGSSTASTLNIDVQYSQDGVDWYADNLNGIGSQMQASTSPNIGGVEQFSFIFASSTINRILGTAANGATSTRLVSLSTLPTRYVRFIFSSPAGSTPEAFWAEFRGKKQERTN